MGLIFLISNFFTNKTSLANKWMRKNIPSCSNLALVELDTIECLNSTYLKQKIMGFSLPTGPNPAQITSAVS